MSTLIFTRRLWIKLIQLNTWTLVFATTTLILISSFAIHLLEPETFITPFEGLWWTMTTVATVGYGDVSPTTVRGKIFAMILYVVGIGLMTVFIGKVIDSFSLRKRLKEEGKLVVQTKNHIVLINWSKKAEITLQELLHSFNDIHIVIIDETLKKVPLMHERVDFVSGDPESEEVLLKANILECKTAMLFAPDALTTASQADGQTLLVASILKDTASKFGKNIYTICEVSNSKHIQAFAHAEVEEFITSNDTAAHLAARSILFNGSSEIIRQLTSNKGHDLYHIPKKSEWKTFSDASNELASKGALLIANHNDLSIISKLDQDIPNDAKLFIICDDDTYQLLM
ncbi:ion channel [Metabacillus herbersteinensis]|uniref:Ion channel n=1 Tax=Metabacillus herbersteinensis TaxID=283816 RepID=A0ABV6GAL7_9BACI